MSKQMKILWIIMIQSLGIVAGNTQETFLKANALYETGNSQEALKLYQSIEPKGMAVEYNIGNCCYRMSKYPEAILHWRRAQKDASWRDYTTLSQYITQAYEDLGIQRDMSYWARVHSYLNRIASLFSIFFLQILFLMCWIVVCWLFPRLLKRSSYFMVVVLSIVTLFMGILVFLKYRNQEYPCGIVTKNSISVYAGPGRDYAQLMQAKMLDEIRVYQHHGGWIKVYVHEYGYGWIAEADIAII